MTLAPIPIVAAHLPDPQLPAQARGTRPGRGCLSSSGLSRPARWWPTAAAATARTSRHATRAASASALTSRPSWCLLPHPPPPPPSKPAPPQAAADSVTLATRCPWQVRICKRRGQEVLAGDATALPYRSASFDAAISIAVLHHLSTRARRLQVPTTAPTSNTARLDTHQRSRARWEMQSGAIAALWLA